MGKVLSTRGDMPNAHYRIRGNAHLWTWSQVAPETDHARVAAILQLLDPTYYIIAKERHRDGGIHYHAYAEYRQRQDRNLTADFFLDNQRPNIKAKRSHQEKETAATYCRKDGDYIEHGTFAPPQIRASAHLQAAINEAGGEMTKYIEYLIDNNINHPLLRDYWISSNAAWRLNTIYDGDSVKDADITSFALNALLYDPAEQRTYVLRGPSGVGKTTWAIRNIPKPSLWVRHADTLKLFQPLIHKSILIDEVSWRHTPHANQINICDTRQVAEIHIRYQVARIPPGVPRIFTCNPGEENLDFDYPPIARRIYLVDC